MAAPRPTTRDIRLGIYLQSFRRAFLQLRSEIDATIVRAQDAGWSSLVARQAHNLKAAGSNPAPATNFFLSFLQVHVRIFPTCSIYPFKASCVPGSGWQSEAVMDKTLCETFETVSEARFVSVQDNSNLRKLLMD